MSRISVDVSSARIPVLQVGYQGENEVTDVLFDISSWITEFGEGVAQLRVKRPGNSEEESYVLSLTITDGKAVWTVSDTDTFNKGSGKVQLSYLVGNIVKKAVIYPYKVGKSIVGADNPVDPFDSWIERSKAWAIGETLEGDAVPETDETYQNNAKYYAEQADILGSAQVVLATEQATLATAKATLATEKADAAAASEANAAASEAAVNGVSTQLTTRMSAIETEQAVQDARMDTFTSLPEGSTSGNAELADIRVGSDGTTYDTAGNAVRGQIGELKSDLNELEEIIGLRFKPITKEVSAVGYSFIEVVKFTVISECNYTLKLDFASATTGQVWINAYDANGNAITQLNKIDTGSTSETRTFKLSTDYENATIKVACEPSMANVPFTLSLSSFDASGTKLNTVDFLEKINQFTEYKTFAVKDGYILNNGYTYITESGKVTEYINIENVEKVVIDYGKEWVYNNYYQAFYTNCGLLDSVVNVSASRFLELDVPQTAKLARFCFPTTYSDGVKIYLKYKESYYSTKQDIVSLNQNQDSAVSSLRNNGICLMHFSDLHGNNIGLSHLMDYAEAHSDYIDDIICTGDIVLSKHTDDYSFFESNAENVLVVLGNHEQCSGTGANPYHDYALNQADAYTKYMSTNISKWGVTSTVGKTYWYKDYESGIRLIGMESTTANLTESEEAEENSWLANVLDDAKTKGLSVVIAEHYPPANAIKIDCNFNDSANIPIGSLNTFNEMHQASVDSFISDGGDFICYLCGHTHRDFISYNSNYPNQPFITVGNASMQEDGDMKRILNEKSEDLANVVAFDKVNNLIKIVRIGADYDRYLRHRGTVCINYKTMNVISSN